MNSKRREEIAEYLFKVGGTMIACTTLPLLITIGLFIFLWICDLIR